MKKINWKVRIANKKFWLALIPAVLLLVQTVAAPFGYEWDFVVLNQQLAAIINSIFAVLAIIGVVNDPTTDGLADSARALAYKKPYTNDKDAKGGYAGVLPFKGRNRVSQPYTWPNGRNHHGGIDIVGMDDPTVYAVEAGTVTMISKWDGHTKTGTQSYGNLVVVTDNNGRRHYYAHLKSIAVSKGRAIHAGSVIGVMGSTGNSTGPHLHYEVRTGYDRSTRTNPTEFIDIDNKKDCIATLSEPVDALGTYYPTEDLNIRSGPSVHYGVVKTNGAKYNQPYKVYEKKKAGTQYWGRIGNSAWICLAYCRTSDEEILGIYHPTEDLNVRSGAGVLHKVVKKDAAKKGYGYAVYEKKKAGTQYWGRIAPKEWICLAYCTE